MQEGFFTKKETESKSRPDGKRISCTSCGLYQNCNSPRMQPFGNFKKGILNIGEAPGETEDKNGKPFQGKTGQLLQRTYEKLGIDLFEDCLNINAVRCFPDKTPTNYEIECCRRLTLKTIEEYKPKVIVLFGNAAIYSLIGHRWKKDLGGITKWRGWTIPDQDLKAWVCPTFHPSFIERSESGVEEVVWINDLKQILFTLEHVPFPVYKEPVIHITDNLSFLKDLPNEIVFDYETTSLKPHAEGQRIVCCSIAVNEDEVYVFMMPKSPKERKPWVNILADKRIGKIAQNMKFEHSWSLVRLGVEVQNWIWDTMITAHILDNREGITNLAFQTYVNFGIIDYKDETDIYLQADKKNGNATNRIIELIANPGGKEMLLKRCALDSIYEMRLYKKQSMEFLPF